MAGFLRSNPEALWNILHFTKFQVRSFISRAFLTLSTEFTFHANIFLHFSSKIYYSILYFVFQKIRAFVVTSNENH